ncbi:MAG: ATP-binding protein [Candidatus Binataceae bacterium]
MLVQGEVASPKQDEARWAARLVGAGSSLTFLFQVAYLALDWRFVSLNHPWVLIFHLTSIALFTVAVLMTLRVGPWMRSHWKPVAFAFSTAMIFSMAGIAILTADIQPFFIALMLFLAGTGPFLSWGERTQALLSLVAFIGFAVAVVSLPDRGFNPYEAVGILIAAAIGLFSTALESRLRRARRTAEQEVLKSRETLLLQERLRVAGQLASGIAHDLNNTLNVVKLRLAALSQDDAVRTRHAARLQALDHAIADAARTITRVRELGKRGEEINSAPVQMSEIIAQAIDLARSSIEGRPSLHGPSITISSHLPDLLPMVKGPGSDLRQVFLNLLLNAADAIHDQGEIEIESAVEDDCVVVRVADSGTGIPDENLGRIFESFFTTKGPHGTGLGLSMAREIMEGIGGSIEAANQAAGGAVFILKFPLATAEPGRPQASTAQQTAGCCRFLLVDDDFANLDSLRENLVRSGHDADIARSGAEAIEKLRTQRNYDLILCDLGMPRMNGWEVARQAHEIARNTAFYILTGWGREIEDQMPPSVSGILSKPIDLNEIARIASIARSRAVTG